MFGNEAIIKYQKYDTYFFVLHFGCALIFKSIALSLFLEVSQSHCACLSRQCYVIARYPIIMTKSEMPFTCPTEPFLHRNNTKIMIMQHVVVIFEKSCQTGLLMAIATATMHESACMN